MKLIFVLCLIGGMVVLSICGADLISSSILCDGATWTSSAVTGPDRTYGASFFTTDRANISRDLVLTDGVSSRVRVASTGPMGVDEYSWQMRNTSDPETRCVFDARMVPVRDEEISLSGLFKTGEYLGNRQMSREGTVAGSVIQADGMINRMVSTEDENGSLFDRTFLAGRMNSSEFIELIGGVVRGSA